MKVRCVKIINPATLEVESSSTWVRMGEEYLVLELMGSPNGRLSLRILHDDNSTGIWDSEMFVDTDPTVPSNWVARVSEGGRLHIGPPRWLDRGFWERYFDDEPTAVEAFKAEMAVIRDDSGRLG
ncbi:hypothetical protein AB0F43_29955 [Kribbella sp. NPDC023972]|uniref:hypothetical protein n=1 Tax=Kribbella sp. NPDC023972 TaxID=3154795 RepID=UPI0033E9625C